MHNHQQDFQKTWLIEKLTSIASRSHPPQQAEQKEEKGENTHHASQYIYKNAKS
jgi:hypothetical protein